MTDGTCCGRHTWVSPAEAGVKERTGGSVQRLVREQGSRGVTCHIEQRDVKGVGEGCGIPGGRMGFPDRGTA